VPNGHPRLCPPVLSVGKLEDTSQLALGDVCTQRGLGESRGWFLVLGVWKGRERKGGCKLGEKVRHAINKWHPGKEMSVCGSSNTAVPETGNEMGVVWGIKSTGSGARATAEGALHESGGSKRGCRAAQAVTGDAIAAEWGLGTHQSQAALRSRLLGP